MAEEHLEISQDLQEDITSLTQEPTKKRRKPMSEEHKKKALANLATAREKAKAKKAEAMELKRMEAELVALQKQKKKRELEKQMADLRRDLQPVEELEEEIEEEESESSSSEEEEAPQPKRKPKLGLLFEALACEFQFKHGSV